MRKLTERQLALISEAHTYSIAEINGSYYRIGGHGTAPLRYNYLSYWNLEKLGLVERSRGYWKTTPAGIEALEKVDAARDGGPHVQS